MATLAAHCGNELTSGRAYRGSFHRPFGHPPVKRPLPPPAALMPPAMRETERVENAREWRAQNPHRRRAAADRRAELMVTNPGFCPFDAAEREALKRRHDYRCAYCGVRPEDPLERDHVVPLTKGGRHAIATFFPACGACNRSKSDALLAVWSGGDASNPGEEVSPSQP